MTFYRRLLSEPAQISAIAPSSRHLATLITSELSRETGRVVELGPGTGVFTQAILARGVAPQDLTALELDPEFVRQLRLRFPGVDIRHRSATRLAEVAAPGSVGAVVSGLPLKSMGRFAQMRILEGALSLIEGQPKGAFYQFTYFRVCPIAAEIRQRCRAEARLIGMTIRNAPPAWVWKFTRAA